MKTFYLLMLTCLISAGLSAQQAIRYSDNPKANLGQWTDQHPNLEKVTIGKNTFSYKGSFLMEIGIPWPVRGAYKSQIVEIK